MAQYRDLYSGGDYVIHFKYSSVLNCIYIACLYGVGMPILFPIAALTFINTYICERFTVIYFMKQPPALDEKLTTNAIDMLKYAPLLMVTNGFWMVSNGQIFQNKHVEKDHVEDRMQSGHFFQFKVNWAFPVLYICMASVILLII